MKPSPVNPPAGSIPCSRKLMRGIITVEVDLSKAVYRSITGEAMCRSRPITTCRTSLDNGKSAGSSVWYGLVAASRTKQTASDALLAGS